MQRIVQGSICGEWRACSVNYGKRSAIYIHLQQTLICCTACLQAPSILGCSIDISGCSTIVSHINHPAEPLETILIGLWWWWRSEPQRGVSAVAKPGGNRYFRWHKTLVEGEARYDPNSLPVSESLNNILPPGGIIKDDGHQRHSMVIHYLEIM